MLVPFSPQAQPDVPAIAAASNIKFALDEIATQFAQETGLKLRISYGSSGNFVAQIRHGAPFELFLSADERYIEQLEQAGFTRDAGVDYAVGRLALVAPKQSSLQLDPQLVGLRIALSEGQISRFAIANPEHAPYGQRAKTLLQQLDLWDLLKPSLIYGENVSQAAQFAVSGSTQGGIIALSLASAPQFTSMGQYVELPADMHAPLTQRMVLMPNAGTTAQQFYRYLLTEPARATFLRYGFGLPQLVR